MLSENGRKEQLEAVWHETNITALVPNFSFSFWLNVFGILELCFWETKRNGEERRLWGRMATAWSEREEKEGCEGERL